MIMSEECIPLDYDILSVEEASQKSRHVPYIVVGIVFGVLVVVVLLVLVLLLLWKRDTVKRLFCK